jgi:hypothetical protein
MKLTLYTTLTLSALLTFACNDHNRFKAQDDAEATIANETGAQAPLPKDVIYTSSSLINGKLYARPSFDGTIISHFDTSQQLHIIDTSDNVFVKVRLQQDTALHTGYVSKAILPEQR